MATREYANWLDALQDVHREILNDEAITEVFEERATAFLDLFTEAANEQAGEEVDVRYRLLALEAAMISDPDLPTDAAATVATVRQWVDDRFNEQLSNTFDTDA